jgi:hypothetical protein
MTLIPNWREAWRWFSIQSLALIMLLPTIWEALPSDAKVFIPEGWGIWIVVLIAAAGIVGRLVDQNKNVS